MTPTVRIDAREFNATLVRYVALSSKDSAEILKSKAADVALRSAEAAKTGRQASSSEIKNIWQSTNWDSKKPWQKGRDWWGLFISKLLSHSGFKLNLGRRRARTEAEKNVTWLDTVTGKMRSGWNSGPGGSFERGRRSLTSRRFVRRGQMKSSDWKRVSSQILKRRAARVGAFVGAFTRVAALFGKSRFVGKRSWAATARLPTPNNLTAFFEVPIKGSKYPMLGDKNKSQAAHALEKEVILYRYLQRGIDFVARDMADYIARKLVERANKLGLRAA